MLKTYFRYFIINKLTIWLILLFITFFAINKAINNIIKQSSFKLLYNYRPDFHIFVKDNFTLKRMLIIYNKVKKLKLLKK